MNAEEITKYVCERCKKEYSNRDSAEICCTVNEGLWKYLKPYRWYRISSNLGKDGVLLFALLIKRDKQKTRKEPEFPDPISCYKLVSSLGYTCDIYYQSEILEKLTIQDAYEKYDIIPSFSGICNIPPEVEEEINFVRERRGFEIAQRLRYKSREELYNLTYELMIRDDIYKSRKDHPTIY